MTSPFRLTGFFNGGKALKMASMPCLDSLLQLRTAVTHDMLETGLERKFDGKRIAICGFRRTTASFLRVLFSSKQDLVATSTTGHCGPAISLKTGLGTRDSSCFFGSADGRCRGPIGSY